MEPDGALRGRTDSMIHILGLIILLYSNVSDENGWRYGYLFVVLMRLYGIGLNREEEIENLKLEVRSVNEDRGGMEAFLTRPCLDNMNVGGYFEFVGENEDLREAFEVLCAFYWALY